MNTTEKHQQIRADFISDMQNIIDKATSKNIEFNDIDKFWTLSDFLKKSKANTPTQIADKTAEFIRLTDMSETGVENGQITFNYFDSVFTVPDAESLPSLLRNVKSKFGDGKTHDPGKRIDNERSAKLQRDVWIKRCSVQSSDKNKKAYLRWLKNPKTDKSDPLYLCHKFILNPLKIEGINIPAVDQPVKFTPINQLSESEKAICLGKPQQIPQKQQKQSLQLVKYSDRAVALIGDTKPLKEKLSELWGSYNPHLKINGETVKGWVFSAKREPQLRQLIAS